MPLDADAIRRTCRGATVETARFLCRDQIDQFRKANAIGSPITVTCTQEAPLFEEVAGDRADLTFVNIRETGGWSNEATQAGPKMAALIAAAAEPLPELPVVSMSSDGVVLEIGRAHV